MKAEGLSTGLTTLTSLPAMAARALIRAYQLTLSPFIGNQCRFHPSCSNYALEAIDVHGAVKGSWLVLKRLGRCHPFDPGGFDPVPGNSEKSNKRNKSTNQAPDCCPEPKEI